MKRIAMILLACVGILGAQSPQRQSKESLLTVKAQADLVSCQATNGLQVYEIERLQAENAALKADKGPKPAPANDTKPDFKK